MTMAHLSGFLPNEAEQLTITGAPGTIGEVKTSVVWVQVPSEDGTVHLELVHRVSTHFPVFSPKIDHHTVRSRDGEQLV